VARNPRTPLAAVCAALNAERARYLVVGASALQLWGSTRATRDIDILIDPTIENARRVIDALSNIGFGLAKELTPQEIVRNVVTVVGDNPNIDILTRAWNLTYADAAPGARTFKVEAVSIPAPSIEDLIESKQTGRLQDDADIQVLEAIRDLEDQRS
jgi:hypothetical protein